MIYSSGGRDQGDFHHRLGRQAPDRSYVDDTNLSQVHTVIIYVIMMMSVFVVYTTSSLIGSPAAMWELLKEAAVLHPVEGNADGSYLTMRSQGMLFPE
jgi:hypothetical protein